MRPPAGEQRVDLALFYRDGHLVPVRGVGRRLPDLSAGRTDSRRGLGFILRRNGRRVAFVLDHEQVKALHVYLGHQRRRIKRG